MTTDKLYYAYTLENTINGLSNQRQRLLNEVNQILSRRGGPDIEFGLSETERDQIIKKITEVYDNRLNPLRAEFVAL